MILTEKAERREGKQVRPGKNSKEERREIGAGKPKEDRRVKCKAGGEEAESCGSDLTKRGPVSSRSRLRRERVQIAEAESQRRGSWDETCRSLKEFVQCVAGWFGFYSLCFWGIVCGGYPIIPPITRD